MTLSHRQSRALAGEWDRVTVEAHGDNLGDAVGWEESLNQLYPEDSEEGYRAYLLNPSKPKSSLNHNPKSVPLALTANTYANCR